MPARAMRLPIFRAFTHPKLENVGLRGGVATPKDLQGMATITNTLIDKKLHVPPLRQTHSGSPDGTSRGWVERVEVEGDTLFGLCTFTETGQNQVKGGDLRWFSSGFRKDFRLTGEPTSPLVPGIYLDHVAMLGDQHPQVKGLIDLSTVEFAEGQDKPEPDTVFISLNESTGEVNYFAQMEDEMPVDSKTTLDPAMALFMDRLDEQGKAITKLTADLAEARTKTEAAEAKLAEASKATETAKFAEFDTKVITPALEVATKALKLGAEDVKHWRAIAARCYGDREAEAAFTEVIKALTPKVPGSRIPAPAKADNTAADLEDDGAPGSAEFAEGNTDLTLAVFNEANTNAVVAQKLMRVLAFERAKRKVAKPELFTINDLRAEYATRTRR